MRTKTVNVINDEKFSLLSSVFDKAASQTSGLMLASSNGVKKTYSVVEINNCEEPSTVLRQQSASPPYFGVNLQAPTIDPNVIVIDDDNYECSETEENSSDEEEFEIENSSDADDEEEASSTTEEDAEPDESNVGAYAFFTDGENAVRFNLEQHAAQETGLFRVYKAIQPVSPQRPDVAAIYVVVARRPADNLEPPSAPTTPEQFEVLEPVRPQTARRTRSTQTARKSTAPYR
jgi:hypothetical protein